MPSVTPHDGSRETLRTRVKLLATDFALLDELFPGEYPKMIVRGEGSVIWDDDGRELVDTGLHWGATNIGHGRKEIATAIAAQAERFEFGALYAGYGNAAVAELTERLASLVPIDDPGFAFSSSGSEANELAFHIARAYHARRGEPGRVKIISRSGGYHGSSLAAVTATALPSFHDHSMPLAPGFVYTAQPSPGRCGYCTAETGCTLDCAEDLERTIAREGPETVAAFIAEPVGIQQAVKVTHAAYWDRVQEICRAYGVLLISDEVVNGFGRTGKLFACEHWEIRPDMHILAKGITGGYVPLAATVMSPGIRDMVIQDSLVHANTWAGHPVACAAALATLDILEREDLCAQAARKGELLRDAIDDVQSRNDCILRSSSLGLLASIEYRLPGDDGGKRAATRLRHDLCTRGVFARVGISAPNVGFTTYYPALVIDDADITRSIAALDSGIRAVQ